MSKGHKQLLDHCHVVSTLYKIIHVELNSFWGVAAYLLYYSHFHNSVCYGVTSSTHPHSVNNSTPVNQTLVWDGYSEAADYYDWVITWPLMFSGGSIPYHISGRFEKTSYSFHSSTFSLLFHTCIGE